MTLIALTVQLTDLSVMGAIRNYYCFDSYVTSSRKRATGYPGQARGGLGTTRILGNSTEMDKMAVFREPL